MKARKGGRKASKKRGVVYIGKAHALKSSVFRGKSKKLNKGQPKPRLMGTSGHGYK